MAQDEIEKLRKIALEDPRYLIESAFMVLNKEGQVVPFIFTDLQNEFYEQRTYRDDILKGSQLGFSTMILAILTIRFLLIPNRWGVSMSHEFGATGRLFEKVKFFLKHLPAWLKPFYIPGTESAHELTNLYTNSKLYIGTAGARAFGRGDTIHDAHLSEVSRWKSFETVTNIIRAVPLNSNTWVVKETTANGVGTPHHEEWQREKEGKSEFQPFFAPWYKHKEYRIEGVLDNPTELEETYKRRFGISDDVLLWRRKQLKNMNSENGRSPEDMFKQEFPMDDKEAFLSSGNPFFPVEQIERYREKVKKPLLVGNLYGIFPNETFDPAEKGYLRVYKKPEAGGQYLIAGDVSQFNDRSVAVVIDKKTWEQVAVWRGVVGASQFGDELARLGYWYNKALVIPEANNMGQSTVDRLVTLGYPHIYQRQRFNQVDEVETNEYGWWTDSKTKPQMLGNLHDLIRTEQIPIADETILNELATYVRLENGQLGATAGHYDDCVIATAIAYFVLKMFPYRASSTAVSKPISRVVRNYKRLRHGKSSMNRR